MSCSRQYLQVAILLPLLLAGHAEESQESAVLRDTLVEHGNVGIADNYSPGVYAGPRKSIKKTSGDGGSVARKLNQIAPTAAKILSLFPVKIIGFGQVTGYTIETDSHVVMSQFLGIPYAQPPMGDLRFSRPKSRVTNSNSVHPAFNMSSLCIQPEPSANLPMSEDCLYLNIWTPLHASKDVKDLPVLIFLHGGFFHSGGIADDRWRGSRMLNHEDHVVVTVNYRLGVFGFLSLDTSIPGNLGLWDQELAIEWVSKYIEKFAGSKKKVTLVGVEAGAAAVAYHMARNGDKFQRAVMLTGSPYMRYPVSSDTNAVLKRNQDFVSGGQWLNCTVNTMECLRNLSANFINERQREFPAIYYGIPLKFPPVTDGDFIKVDPWVQDASTLARIPLMIGVVSSPGNWLVRRFFDVPSLTDSVYLRHLESMTKFFPRDPQKTTDSEINEVKKYFPAQGEMTKNARTFSTAIGSFQFTCAINDFLNAAAVHRDVYSFRFVQPIANDSDFPEATLFDDAHTAFGNPAAPGTPQGPQLPLLSQAMIRSLVAFASTSNPTWANSDWPRYLRENRTTLVMSLDSVNSFQLVNDTHMERECRFWATLNSSDAVPTTTTPGMSTTEEAKTATVGTGTTTVGVTPTVGTGTTTVGVTPTVGTGTTTVGVTPTVGTGTTTVGVTPTVGTGTTTVGVTPTVGTGTTTVGATSTVDTGTTVGTGTTTVGTGTTTVGTGTTVDTGTTVGTGTTTVGATPTKKPTVTAVPTTTSTPPIGPVSLLQTTWFIAVVSVLSVGVAGAVGAVIVLLVKKLLCFAPNTVAPATAMQMS